MVSRYCLHPLLKISLVGIVAMIDISCMSNLDYISFPIGPCYKLPISINFIILNLGRC